MKQTVDKNGKADFAFKVEIKDEDGDIIAEVKKVVYIRKKRTRFLGNRKKF